jgi:phage gpG-like protein
MDHEPLVIKIDFEGQPEVEQKLMSMAAAGKNLLPVFLDFRGRMQRSISLNFLQGGRPIRWPESKRALGQGRGKKKTGQTLRDSGWLMNRITGPGAYKVDDDFLEISTNVKYAATHQYGAKKGSFGTFTAKVRKHKRMVNSTRGGLTEVNVSAHIRQVKLPWGDIPERKFLLVQETDINYLKQKILQHLQVS